MAAAERMSIPCEWIDAAIKDATKGMEPSPFLDRAIARMRAAMDQMTMSVVTRPNPGRVERWEPPPGE